jgi:hypothetical protein
MRFVITLLLATALAGCGFQLRGTADLPFETLYIPGATGGIGLDLKRNIQSGTRTRVVEDAKLARGIVRREPGGEQCRDADQQGLLENQNEDRGYDEGAVSGDGVEERPGDVGHRTSAADGRAQLIACGVRRSIGENHAAMCRACRTQRTDVGDADEFDEDGAGTGEDGS